jgi:PTH1 family peptidyl-tRNA hydrolase
LQIPSLDHKIGIGQAIDRSLRAVPDFLSGDMTRAMLTVHTSKAPRPKPERQVQIRE